MGWLYKGGYTRAMLIEELTAGWTAEQTGNVNECLRHTTRGNVLWMVWETITLAQWMEDNYVA